jgi:hypothetical protein
MPESSDAKCREQRAESDVREATSCSQLPAFRPNHSALCSLSSKPSARCAELSAPAISIILPTYNRARFLPHDLADCVDALADCVSKDWSAVTKSCGAKWTGGVGKLYMTTAMRARIEINS